MMIGIANSWLNRSQNFIYKSSVSINESHIIWFLAFTKRLYKDMERPMATTLLEQDMFYNHMYIFSTNVPTDIEVHFN
jgi:hypothetical protein